jgi:hypothetical protein
MTRMVALVLMTSALLLTGCATTRVVNSQVRAVATVPAGAQLQGAKYRFERLPLQANNPEAGLAEQQAEQALAAVGLVRDDAQAQLSVQVSFNNTQYIYDPAGRLGAYPWRPYGSLGFGRHGVWGYNMGWGMPPPPLTDYRREVSLVLRDLRSGQVVYETHASHYGIWRDSEPIFATLFKAALANFPNPPAGVQRVNIEIPR